MADVRASADVPAAAHAVYDRLTRFEDLPALLEGVEEVRRAGGGRLQWTARRGGRTVRWETDVIEAIVGERLVWVPAAGTPGESVALTIEDRGAAACRVTLSVTGLPGEDREEAAARARRDLENLRALFAAIPGDAAPPAPPPPAPPPGGPDVDEALGAVPEDAPGPPAERGG